MERAATWRGASSKWTVLLTIGMLMAVMTTGRATAEVFSFAFGSPGTQPGQFQFPTSAAVDSHGNVYVVDSDNLRVQKFDASGHFLLQFPIAPSGNAPVATGIAVDGNDNVYVSDSANNLIRRYTASGTPVLAFLPTCVQISGCVLSGGTGSPIVFSPKGVAVDASNDVYAIGLFHLSKFDGTGTLLTEFPLGGIVPEAIAVDSNGDIVIYEKDNGTINRYDSAGNLLKQFGSPGCDLSTGFGCDDPDGAGPLEPGDGQFGIGGPVALAIDVLHNIYVADPRNSRVEKFDADGTFLLKFGTAGTGMGEFGDSAPNGLAVGGSNVYVVDIGNDRVQVWNAGASNGPDLVEGSVSDPPAAGAPGSQFSVTDKAVNQGNTPAGASTTRHYLSLVPNKTPQSVLLKGTRPVPALGAGGSSQGTRMMVTVPTSIALGTYYLLACADDLSQVRETSESNNCTAAASTMTVGRPDLVVTAVSRPPVFVTRGVPFNFVETVANQGTLRADPSTTRYYLSVDTHRSTDDRRLAASRAVPALDAGATFDGPVPVSLTIPANMPLGTYFVLTCADDLHRVLESDETNNCLASPTPLTVH